eukprot:1122018-Amphidinium_carterae.1
MNPLRTRIGPDRLGSVALTYCTDALAPDEIARAYVLLWSALQENFLLDATIWPVKVYDVLQVFDFTPPAFRFEQLGAFSASQVTLVVPRCPAALLSELISKFPGFIAHVGVETAETALPSHWVPYENNGRAPSGVMMNTMLADVQTPLVLVVIGSALPDGAAD